MTIPEFPVYLSYGSRLNWNFNGVDNYVYNSMVKYTVNYKRDLSLNGSGLSGQTLIGGKNNHENCCRYGSNNFADFHLPLPFQTLSELSQSKDKEGLREG